MGASGSCGDASMFDEGRFGRVPRPCSSGITGKSRRVKPWQIWAVASIARASSALLCG